MSKLKAISTNEIDAKLFEGQMVFVNNIDHILIKSTVDGEWILGKLFNGGSYGEKYIYNKNDVFYIKK